MVVLSSETETNVGAFGGLGILAMSAAASSSPSVTDLSTSSTVDQDGYRALMSVLAAHSHAAVGNRS